MSAVWADRLIEWNRPRSWVSPLSRWLRPYLSKGIRTLERMGEQDLCHDDHTWLKVAETVLNRSHEEVTGQLGDDLSFASIRVFHACRTADAGVYFREGILRNDPDRLAAQLNALLDEEPNLAHHRPEVEKLFADQKLFDRDKGRVYLTADDKGLVESAGHYLLNIMREAVIAEVSTQLSEVVGVIERHLEPTLLAVHLYGSAVDGGLKPHSDIDLLVTVTVRLDETTRRALINDLLETSASPGESEILRAVEVTIVVHDDIIPWRYPAKRELQFGEWQRNDILAGIFEPATIDIDLAILLTKAREHSVALVGPAAEELFDPVPEQDLFEALNETLTLWNSPPDWAGDERNVVLTLSRIWYSAVTGKIAPKDVAADWAMERLPAQYQPVILEARQAYLGQEEDRLASRADQLEEFVHYVKGEITKVVGK